MQGGVCSVAGAKASRYMQAPKPSALKYSWCRHHSFPGHKASASLGHHPQARWEELLAKGETQIPAE